MSDCTLAIKWAVQHAYADLGINAPKHYWCLFHVLKAFKAQANIHLPDRSDEALEDFHQVIYAKAYPASLIGLFLHKWSTISSPFAKYVASQWHTHQGMHTNNYTEAWHRVLKSRYIPPLEKKRMDELVKILCDKAEPHYRSTSSCVEGVFLTQGVSKFQLVAKTTAYGHTPQILELYGSACKHMYLVARDTKRLVVEAAIDHQYKLPDNEPDIIIQEPNVTVVSNPFTGKRAAPIDEDRHPDSHIEKRPRWTAFSNSHPNLASFPR
ncbi:hypothetical protein PCASD_06173 [Puccinia coronata f. sp. avenae]|uniref:MULE transposase domain-containing protein n=1 Tax=Puccinia coronata f. sp. avenae TaxID=200324 RepID=A0A2N5TGH7_9BASI|nr:hypothetical protein PCASD_06173 [Puccinia coronata f. sp. avenae]